MKDVSSADAVFDALGFEPFDESFSILSKHGRLVGYGGNLPALTGRPEQSVIPPTLKLLSHNLKFWDGRKATFY
jgi:NADPH:quinone reductase-like Zn-dependent oxidoreductase